MDTQQYRHWRPKYDRYTLQFSSVSEEAKRAAIVGLSAEAGELLALVQKSVRKGEAIDVHKARDELGDVLWYVFKTLDAFGFTLEEVLEYNKNKLDERNK